MLPSKIHISVTFDENTTQLQNSSVRTIRHSSEKLGTSIILSFPDSLTGQKLLKLLDICKPMIQLHLWDDLMNLPLPGKSGEEPTS